MDTIGVKDKRWEKELSCGKKENDKNLGKSHDWLKRIEGSRLYVARDGITIKMIESATTAYWYGHRSLTATFVAGLVEIFMVTTVIHFWH